MDSFTTDQEAKRIHALDKVKWKKIKMHTLAGGRGGIPKERFDFEAKNQTVANSVRISSDHQSMLCPYVLCSLQSCPTLWDWAAALQAPLSFVSRQTVGCHPHSRLADTYKVINGDSYFDSEASSQPQTYAACRLQENLWPPYKIFLTWPEVGGHKDRAQKTRPLLQSQEHQTSR